jgi:N utilization substance protein B
VTASDNPAAELRHRAREQAVQWLYQWEVGGLHLDDVFDAGRQVDLRSHDKERDRVAEEIVRGTAERLGEIDPLIAEAAANWRLERLAVIDRLILRLATYELLAMPGTPHAVIINEALELARTFSTEDAVKFVNGVLDGIRKKVRE